MKNIFKSSLLLIGALAMFTACSDDNGSNPTLVEPNSFVLNTPAYATQGIDLKSSDRLNFTWSQPDYGYPAAVNYAMQVSIDGNFTVSTEEAEAAEAAAEEAGEESTVVANYANVEIQDEDHDLKGTVAAEDVATALQKIAKYTEADVPDEQPIKVRLVANTTGAKPVFSNVVDLNVVPYYVELQDAALQIWYITGAFTPDGGWKNNADGSNMLPMLPDPTADVNKKTGETILEWAGFIPEGGQFKIIAPAGLSNWNYGICGGDEEGGQVYRDGGDDPGNIVYNAGGWVKLTLNTATKELTFTAIDAPAAFSTITMPGTYNGWDATANAMTAAGMDNAHDWSGTVTFDADASVADDEGVKFAIGNWDTNWGNEAFPYGAGAQNGPNIRYKAGSYKVLFNDILGYYYFIAQ